MQETKDQVNAHAEVQIRNKGGNAVAVTTLLSRSMTVNKFIFQKKRKEMELGIHDKDDNSYGDMIHTYKNQLKDMEKTLRSNTRDDPTISTKLNTKKSKKKN